MTMTTTKRTNTPFGYTLMVDMYGVPEELCDSLEVHYRFLEELVDVLDMHKTSPPVAFHGPRVRGIELFPDKAGVSAWIPLVESGIQIHSVSPKNFITLDVYSCRPFSANDVIEFARKTFLFKDCDHYFMSRGSRYNEG